MGSTYGRTTCGVACHHLPRTARTVERHRAWHEITTLGKHTRWNDVGRCMTSPHFDSTHYRTTSGVTCHHRLWTSSHSRTAPSLACNHRLFTENGVERLWAWHDIIAFGQHTWSNDVGRGITSPPFDSTHGRTTSGVACHHHLWAAHTVERRRAWHAIIALGRQTGSNDVRCGIPSSLLN